MMVLHVVDIAQINVIDSYDPKSYNVTDKATQPNVIGYAIAAATEALKVYT